MNKAQTNTLSKLRTAYRSLVAIYPQGYKSADSSYSLAHKMHDSGLAYMRLETACLYPQNRPKTKALLDKATIADLRWILDGIGSKVSSFERSYSDECQPDDEEIDDFLAARISWFNQAKLELTK